MTLTPRETHVLIAAVILLIVLFFIPQETVNEIEIYLLVFVLFPLGLYLATEPVTRNL